jgi:hypothetical protein
MTICRHRLPLAYTLTRDYAPRTESGCKVGQFKILQPHAVEVLASRQRTAGGRITSHMKIKIIGSSGGYRNCVYELDALPHVGEVLSLGNWQGTVAEVMHIPEEHRKDGMSAHIELTQVHKVQDDASQPAPGQSSEE